jgi:hypothetical protein
MDASDAVDAYLQLTYRIGLEEVLTQVTDGRVPAVLASAVNVAVRRVDIFRDEDGGISELFEGTIAIAGIEYRFCCATFIDRAGTRFVSHLGEFAPVEWQARLVVPPPALKRA